MANVTRFPSTVRTALPPLGLYVHPGQNDHVELLNLISSGDGNFFGAIFDASLLSRHADLKTQILDRKLDAILDPQTQRSATIGGYTRSLGKLPWAAPDRPHNYSDFLELEGRRRIALLANFILENGFTETFAPTHLISGPDDPWFEIDINLTRQLRDRLDRIGGTNVPIIYPLAVPQKVFRHHDQRRQLIDRLKTVPASQIWLSIEGFGANSTPTAALGYLRAATEFHELGVPIVGDHVGGAIGLGLVALGAVGGIAHGVTLGERFDPAPWRKPRNKDSKFGTTQRIYVPAIDAMLNPAEAKALITSSTRARGHFACNNPRCCPRGLDDMLAKHKRHFLFQRISEITALSSIPEQLRPQRFLDTHLRAASDKAVAAASIAWEDEAIAKKMLANRKRLDDLRISLGDYVEKNPPQSFALLPETRITREAHR